jgi:hypothetical protein
MLASAVPLFCMFSQTDFPMDFFSLGFHVLPEI